MVLFITILQLQLPLGYIDLEMGKKVTRKHNANGVFSAPGTATHGVWNSRGVGMLPDGFSLMCPRRCQSLPTSEWLLLSVRIMSASPPCRLAESITNDTIH